MTPRLFLGLTLASLVLVGGCDKAKKKPPATDLISDKPTPVQEATPAPTAAPNPSAAAGSTNFQYGAGAAQNIRGAAKRTEVLAEMNQLGLFMKQMETENGKVPGAMEVKEYIKRDAPKIVALIDDGSIILTGTKNSGGLWAYQKDSDKEGGIILVAGSARRATVDEVKQLLAQK